MVGGIGCWIRLVPVVSVGRRAVTGDVLITALWGATVLGVARARLRSIIRSSAQIDNRRKYASTSTRSGTASQARYSAQSARCYFRVLSTSKPTCW